MDTNCDYRSEHPNTARKVAYKSGIHAIVAEDFSMAAACMPADAKGRAIFLRDFVEGYMDAYAAAENIPFEDNVWTFESFPSKCTDCKFLRECYSETTGKGGIGGLTFRF